MSQTGRLGDHTVGRIGYGTLQLSRGERLTDHQRANAQTVLRRAVELGVNHLDTADFYGDGLANDLVREALHPYPEDLVLVTKVGASWDPEHTLVPAQRPAELRTQVESNLRRLGVERLAVVNLRRLDIQPGIIATGDQRVDLDSQLAELVALRAEGKIEGIGVSNVTLDQLRAALPVGLACVQNYYNLLDRSGEPLLEECARHDVAWVPYWPLGGAFPSMPKVTQHAEVVEVAERLGSTPSQVGLAWLLDHDPHVLLIPGTTSVAHLAENLAAGDVRLDDEARTALDALWR